MGMIDLSKETQALAERIAAVQRLPVEAAIRQALESHARVVGIEQDLSPRRRMTVEQIMAFGAELAAMPILDPRSPNEIMDDLNAV
jgi:antitoxin VapB